MKKNVNRAPTPLDKCKHPSDGDEPLFAGRLEPHLQQNLEVSQDGAYTSALLAACDNVWDLVRGATSKYNR